jgi:hypothetical protein
MKYILHWPVGGNRRKKAIDTDLVKQAGIMLCMGKELLGSRLQKALYGSFGRHSIGIAA